MIPTKAQGLLKSGLVQVKGIEKVRPRRRSDDIDPDRGPDQEIAIEVIIEGKTEGMKIAKSIYLVSLTLVMKISEADPGLEIDIDIHTGTNGEIIPTEIENEMEKARRRPRLMMLNEKES